MTEHRSELYDGGRLVEVTIDDTDTMTRTVEHWSRSGVSRRVSSDTVPLDSAGAAEIDAAAGELARRESASDRAADALAELPRIKTAAARNVPDLAADVAMLVDLVEWLVDQVPGDPRAG